MRHRKRKHKLNMSLGHRKSVLMNLAKSIFTHKRITTTLARAKAVQPLVEKIITYSKKEGLHAYRMVETELHDQRMVKYVVEEISPHYKETKGGYTRILHLDSRLGDCAKMAMIELVGDYEIQLTAKKKKTEEDKSETPSEDNKKVVKKVVIAEKAK